jgi:DNA repair protein SbcC/Rad50
MRLHVLEVEAFGPFAAHEHVDFDALSDSGLFLLCGPTGAGKTSVLDAVCFALFGQVPGDRDKAKRLHSDHAAPGSGPRVVLEVSLRGRRLRITRSPDWMRPKKRGTGEIREHAKALVEERVAGRWQQRTNRIDEAADLLGSLLGLTMSQFCQVALLPQGRFETFLRSGAQERHALLERLFGTHRFRAVEDWLADHRRAVSAASDEHARRVAAVVERVAEASALEQPEEVTPDDAADWADGLRRDTVAALAEATAARSAADQRAKAARATLDTARDRAALQRRYRDAKARDAELRSLAGSTERMAAQVEQARLAATVRPLVDVHDAARRRAHEAAAAVQHVRSEMPADDPGTAREHGHDEVTALVRRRHDEVSRLESLLPAQRRLAEIDRELEGVAADLADNDAERTRLRSREKELTPLLESARQAYRQAEAAKAQVQPLRERLARVRRLAEAAARLPELTERRESLAGAAQSATDAAQGARDHWLDLRQARLDGMAAELAHDLDDGHPCPVCGSCEHPAPADPDAHAVSADAEHDAEQAWRRAEQTRERSAEALAGCEREIAAAGTAAEGTDPATAATRLDEAESDLARVEELASQPEQLSAQVAAYEQEIDAARHRERRLEAERAQLVERQTLRRRERRDLNSEVEAAAGAAQSLAHRLAQARRAAQLAEQLLDVLREHSDASRGHQQAIGRLEVALSDNGFADADEVRAALMTRTDLSNAETLIRRRADQAAQTRAVLDDPRVVEATSEPAVVLEPLVEELELAERLRDETVTRERALERQSRRLEQLCADLRAALTAWRPVLASLAVAERMASLCAGTSADNRHKMRLSAYVLAARLEQVVAAANDRLLQMSSGRFTLRHSLARGVGDRRGGLGMQVHDGWTGDLRDPATLSGGETFYTSLALALGLADVVAHEAGGTEIDTLFVDEGFGSLDADTLDEVMDVLDQLRSGGRAVGIVSHVGDLRARVPAQVHVRKTPTGSTLAPA